MAEIVIDVNNVTMRFNIYKERVDNLKELVVRKIKRNLTYEAFYALKEVSFKVEKGEALGIIGRNGSGKSTMLKILAGVMRPTEGTVTVKGSVAPMIELGAGFDPELTARENIFLNGAVLGYSKHMIEENFEKIVEFSELQQFIDVPVKNFSSGMYARLGFSVATVVKPDILILDEVLGVGDFKFQEKCEVRINELVSGDTTVLLVSHSDSEVKKMCKKALWLDNGLVRMFGNVDEVCDIYANT